MCISYMGGVELGCNCASYVLVPNVLLLLLQLLLLKLGMVVAGFWFYIGKPQAILLWLLFGSVGAVYMPRGLILLQSSRPCYCFAGAAVAEQLQYWLSIAIIAAGQILFLGSVGEPLASFLWWIVFLLPCPCSRLIAVDRCCNLQCVVLLGCSPNSLLSLVVSYWLVVVCLVFCSYFICSMVKLFPRLQAFYLSLEYAQRSLYIYFDQ